MCDFRGRSIKQPLPAVPPLQRSCPCPHLHIPSLSRLALRWQVLVREQHLHPAFLTAGWTPCRSWTVNIEVFLPPCPLFPPSPPPSPPGCSLSRVWAQSSSLSFLCGCLYSLLFIDFHIICCQPFVTINNVTGSFCMYVTLCFLFYELVW